jgi:hypothetical protein
VILISQTVRAIRVVWHRFRPLNVWARYAQEASPYRRRPGRTWGVLASILAVIASLVLVGIGGGLLYLEKASRAYTSFPSEEATASGKVIAQVQCLPGADEADMVLSCTLVVDNQPDSVSATIEGVRWDLEAEVLIWTPALERFGLHSGYRLLRLVAYGPAGQVTAEIDLPTTGGGLGSVIPWLEGRFRFVQARQEIVSGETSSDTFYEINVSRSGFSLQQWSREEP